ncbi:MAG: hypothetical protein C0615_10195 [Desulfuromonas sp.]|nr:MAG: hypothetical protein C0615_10195 [Desulfuromonas sp.]
MRLNRLNSISVCRGDSLPQLHRRKFPRPPRRSNRSGNVCEKTWADSWPLSRRINLRFLIIALLLLALSACAPGRGKTENDAEVHYMLGVSYLQANDPTRALQEFLLAEEIEPDDAKLQAALGQAYFYKKSFADSEQHYLQALKLDKGNPMHQNNLAALYMELERWDDAISYFHQAATNLIFSRPEVAWTGYGYAYFKKKDYVTAIDAYVKAIEQNRNYPQAYVRRAETFFALDQPEKAVVDCERALEIYPDYALAHYNLALANMKLRKAGAAITHFQRVIDLIPDSDLAHQSKSYLLVLK